MVHVPQDHTVSKTLLLPHHVQLEHIQTRSVLQVMISVCLVLQDNFVWALETQHLQMIVMLELIVLMD